MGMLFSADSTRSVPVERRPVRATIVRFTSLILGWLILAGLGAVLAGCGAETPRPHVFLFTVDTLRADHLHCYGYFRRTSPTIDALARESVLFENAVSPMSTTLPAHVTLLTGTLPRTHGILGNFHAFHVPLEADAGVQTAAQLFKEMGYTTAAFVSAAVVKKETGLGAGFDFFDEPRSSERRAAATTDKVLAWLDKPHEKPLFVWIHYFDPHWPFEAPAPFGTMFRKEAGLIDFLDARAVPNPENPEVIKWNNGYDGEIAYTDSQLGRVLGKIRTMGWYQDAAIVLTSDHGEGLGQHKWSGHGRIWNEQLFVPLIYKLPRRLEVETGRRSEITGLVDVLPTLVAALELPAADAALGQFQGIDSIAGRSAPRSLFSERTQTPERWGPGDRYALLNLRWKYLHHTHADDELYNMETDRNETLNVIGEFPDQAARMRRRIEEIIENSTRHAPGLDRKDGIDPAREEQIRKLGYGK